MKPLAALWRLGIIAVIGVVAFILVANAIKQPVEAEVRSYTAEFTDSSGLYPGTDVRVRGVRVGKVQSVDLNRHDGQSVAAVVFTLETRYGVVPDTKLAIKYQALTGSRYVDVLNPSEKYSKSDVVTRLPTSMTQPAFDITSLFNGLQPVLATLSPEDMNTFAQNAVDFMSGDGSGLGPMLESIRSLTRFASNRQQVISTVMSNLSTVAEAMGGHSKEMIQLLSWINRPLDSALKVIDQFRMTELYSVNFLKPTQQLITDLGFPVEGNGGLRYISEPPGHADLTVSNIDNALDRAFTNVDDLIEAFKLVPVMWEDIDPPSSTQDPVSAPLPCSKGRFQLPEQMDVLLNGQRVVLCNP